jgi:triphosphoribosyl-dephospho-CoA synthetase
MDYFTFLRSTSSIAAAMYRCAQTGISENFSILNFIRSIGIKAENDMLASTNGVNTQKGLLFLGGIACAAAGSCIRMKKNVNRLNISAECSAITEGIVERELKDLNNKANMTNGEKIYLDYGITGIRGEVVKGLPSVMNTGLPIYEAALKSGLDLNKALVQALIGLMTVVEDTVVINRSGMSGLSYMHNQAKIVLELGGMYTPEGDAFINSLDKEFISRRISPGGAADLLAITVMIHELEQTALNNDNLLASKE